MVDFGTKITEAIYELEGDGFLALKAYDMIKGLETRLQLLESGDTTMCSNTVRVAQTIGDERKNLKLAKEKFKG